MADGVNVKIGVSGIAQFKQNMNQAKTSVKTLDEALKLNEKQFKQTGDAEEYMQQKSELLKQKLEEQKKVVENAERALEDMKAKGVDQASSAFQKMQQELLRAKSDLMDTENSLSGVEEAGQDASDSVSEMNAQLKRIGDGVDFQNVSDGLSTITDSMKAVISKAWQVGEALVNATLGAGSWADELITTATQYEISTEQLQRMRKTANLIDTSAETILSAQDKLTKNRASGSKEFMGALAFLQIDPTGKSNADLFWEAGEAIANMTSSEDKAAYAQKIYGKSWRELMPLFKAGRKEYEETMASWSVVGDEQINNLGKMDDAYQKMQGEWETFKMEMLSAFSGPLTEGMDTITKLFQELNKYLQTPEGKAAIKQIGDTITTLISDLTNVNPETIVGGLQDIVGKVTEALQWISEHKEDVVTAIQNIAIAFGALKLGELAVNVWRFVDGAKNLMGLGGKKAAEKGVETVSDAASASVASGGAMTAASNALTGIATKAVSAYMAAGLETLAPVAADAFLHQTNTGRALLTGQNVLEGIAQDFEETKASIEKNASTFQEDWENNVIYQAVSGAIDKFLTGGNHDAFDETDWEGDAYDLMAAIQARTEEMERGTTQTNSELTQATGTMAGLPGAVEAAILSGLSKVNIYLDGQAVGNVVTPYVSVGMGGYVQALTR